MALTTIASLTQAEKIVWARTTLKEARNVSFIEKFVGKDQNSYIQRISEFSKSEKGATARIHLLHNLVNPGAMGDTTLWDNEEALVASFEDVKIDQIRNANRLKGRLTDQKSVLNFRTESRDVLAYWMANTVDTLAFKTMSGIDYRIKLNGALETGYTYTSGAPDTGWNASSGSGLTFADLEFGAYVSAPSSLRGYRWDTSAGALAVRDVTAIAAADTMSYETIVRLKAMAKEKYLRGVRGAGGEEEFLLIVGPRSMANLRLDSDFLANARALQTGMGDKGQLASGAGGVLVNGVRVIESRYVYNTLGATTLSSANHEGDPGRKWGTNGAAVDGERCLFLGAQALAYADMGLPNWDEQMWDYDNQTGIAIGKIVGMKKTIFKTTYEANDTATTFVGGGTIDGQDFGILTCDVAV